ncbi:DMT family transporter [Litoreibacter sp.]|nr:DMT family transporter [Litoreibacter sp.]
MHRIPVALIGPVCAAVAVTLFSLNDVTMKFLSGDYALHLLVLIRSLVGMMIVLVIMTPLSGGLSTLKTKRLGSHLFRASCVVFANMTFFLGIAALPLATCVAIFFITPSLVTISSAVFLKETVGPRRWAATGVGFLGVLIILRPGSETFQTAALFPLAAAFGIAGLNIMTRVMRDTESAVSMVFYIQATFIVVTAFLGLTIGGGAFADQSDPSLAFLFRAWSWPTSTELPLIMVLGVFAAVGGYFISQAYRLGEAALVAPFEYLSLPLGILWGVLVFGDWPDKIAWIGIGLIAASGLYTVWRENKLQKQTSAARIRR